MKKSIAIAAVLTLGLLASQASAAPFVLIKMRTMAGEDLKQVLVGDIVSYKITAELNIVGTVNTSTTPNKTITSRVNGVDGILSSRFNIQQLLTDPVQVSLYVATLQNGYNAVTFSSPGTLAGRGNGYNNLNSLKAVLAVGVAYQGANAPVTIATGTFRVMEGLVGASSTLILTYKVPSQSPGGMQINGGVSVTATTTNTDPYYSFSGLTVDVVPEPATLAVLALGGAMLAIRRRR